MRNILTDIIRGAQHVYEIVSLDDPGNLKINQFDFKSVCPLHQDIIGLWEKIPRAGYYKKIINRN